MARLPTYPFASGDSNSNVATNIHRVEHDIFMEIQLCRQGTIFYPHFSQSLAQWASTTPRTFSQGHSTKIEFLRCSTLRAAQHYSLPQPSSFPPTPSARVGVLSSASPKKPGGGFLHGGDEQEERIVRLSTLLSSLTSPLAKSFYDEHRTSNSEDGGSGLHDHAILFSPGVVVFRSEPEEEARSQDQIGGRFFGTEERYSVDIVSVSPVNAAAVRQKFTILPEEKDIFEEGMKGAMKERMARALRVFEDQGNKTLILGAFGSGSCENRVEDVAEIWAELLVCGDRGSEEVSGKGRFKDVFDRIVFAVPGKHFEKFKKAFEMRVFEAEVEEAASSESDDE
ncbi:hypothetical protein C8Q75DRAFT_785571 [Abortiporus biennis]|nr:hypothetical protein C8Q75DRAFT_785571 [Abortiporus biennis]